MPRPALPAPIWPGSANRVGLASEAFDIVAAGQCWHWFDRAAAAREALRLLNPAAAW